MNVVWVGVDGAEPIARIASSLEASLEPLGFRRERRPWRAHVTLARVKGRQVSTACAGSSRPREDDFGAHTVDAVHLKKSVLTPQGAEYSVVETVRFGT